ncbi:mechanosensitive ion channel family protein [candidate division KSB1 bacterium]|nr:mechanosensitive ion channel family protein [candidate division KSB1 bacterium]NIR72712.1 mechanosensitive ion channel family protein [candidate division KSB1 bacterium]NIS26797.1 mechanosensitive ion channel family protein [candidate division KSB1 bacterium]NIT73591.1 mechanosensitive ion channel family protein [candidate division KSB1 bacterium]NIU27467.1 mechanosensitive ion channel family protein [candidate division KSB1 bacterium]
MRALNIVLESLRTIFQGFLAHVPQIAAGVTVLLLTWMATRILQKGWSTFATRLRLRKSLDELFQKLLFIGVWLLGLVIASTIIFPGLTPGKLLTVVGLGSVAIGFAFKDIFENFMAGILILIREPFQLGDFIECQSNEGTVEEITIRDTYIRQPDGQLVVLPNAMLFKQPVTVRTDLDRRRVMIICGIAYGEDVDHAREIIRKAVEGLETVDREKSVQIFAKEFGSSSIDFEVTWWTGSRPVDVRRSKDQVVAAVKRALDNAGIEIPFPYRTLTFKEPLKTFVNSKDRTSRVSDEG